MASTRRQFMAGCAATAVAVALRRVPLAAPHAQPAHVAHVDLGEAGLYLVVATSTAGGVRVRHNDKTPAMGVRADGAGTHCECLIAAQPGDTVRAEPIGSGQPGAPTRLQVAWLGAAP